MTKTLKIGILRETKNPPDRRVALTPSQIKALRELYPGVEIFVQPSASRCYSNEEYKYLNIPLKENLTDCDILMGVKETDKKTLIPGKTYLFFAHVAKKQPYNLEMLREIVKKNITLIDYEYLTTDTGQRVVSFGRYAGLVGAYNGIRAFGIRTGRFNLDAAYRCSDLEEMWKGLREIKLDPGLKILITGGGRVAHGAIETLTAGNIKRVNPEDFLTKDFNFPVFCQIGPEHYTKHKNGLEFNFDHFLRNPREYESAFSPYRKVTDIMVACHYWDPDSPKFFSENDMKKQEFRISVIADISCDINGPIPSTIRATTISDPFYCYNPYLEIEEPLFTSSKNIMVMSVDNLPGELPRDASRDFGIQLKEKVLHDLFSGEESKMIKRATITSNGLLPQNFSYLEDYLNGNL